jgi:hypothetical protein
MAVLILSRIRIRLLRDPMMISPPQSRWNSIDEVSRQRDVSFGMNVEIPGSVFSRQDNLYRIFFLCNSIICILTKPSLSGRVLEFSGFKTTYLLELSQARFSFHDWLVQLDSNFKCWKLIPFAGGSTGGCCRTIPGHLKESESNTINVYDSDLA